MKCSILCILLIAAAALVFSAGCSDTAAPGPATTAPGTAGTGAAQYTELSTLALSREDLPFAPEKQEEKFPGEQDNDPTAEYGRIRSYTIEFSVNADDPPNATMVSQSISDYPYDNATPAFEQMGEYMKSWDTAQYTVVPLADPKIGDQSSAMTITGKTGSAAKVTITFIMFRKANVIELIAMATHPVDPEAPFAVARLAAAKIPAAGIVSPPAPATTAVPASTPQAAAAPVRAAVVAASPGLVLARPVTVTASSSGTVDTILVPVRLGDGAAAQDMDRAAFVVSTKNAIQQAATGSTGVRAFSWTGGDTDSLLEPGETLGISLDPAAMGFAPGTPGKGDRIGIEIRPAIGASLALSCTVPASLAAGTTQVCT